MAIRFSELQKRLWKPCKYNLTKRIVIVCEIIYQSTHCYTYMNIEYGKGLIKINIVLTIDEWWAKDFKDFVYDVSLYNPIVKKNIIY